MIKKMFARLLLLTKIILALFVISQIAGLAMLLYLAQPVYFKLRNDGIQLKQKINIGVNSKVPINSKINSSINIPIKKTIFLNLPIKTNLRVFIDKPLTINVTEPVNAYLDQDFRVKTNIDINTDFKIDQDVQTKLFGIETSVPVNGVFPVKLSIPFDQNIKVNEEVSLLTTKPLRCKMKDDFFIPLNFNAATNFKIDENISVPFKTDINTAVRLTGELPCYLYLDIFYDKGKKKIIFKHSIELE